MNCRPPAATWGRTIIAHNFPEIIFGALAKAAPDRVIAACGSTPLAAMYLSGQRLDGSNFLALIAHLGGFGGRQSSDGPNCLGFPYNVANIPIEVTEADAPIVYTHKELLPDSGGPGTNRGGLGQRVGFRVAGQQHAPKGVLTAAIRGSGRAPNSSFPVTGRFGGGSGRGDHLSLNGKPIPHGVQHRLKPGDEVTVGMPGGGGVGDPFQRDTRRVGADLAAGYITAEGAASDYGVAIDPSTGTIDEEKTREQRRERN